MRGFSRTVCLGWACCLWFAVGLPASVAAQEKAAPPATKNKWNVAIVIHEGVELLDFAGPGEVFAAAASGRAFKVYTVAETTKPIVSQHFLKVTPNYSITDCPKPDIIVIPGGYTNQLLRSPAMMGWVKKAAAEADVLLTVCTGAFVAAELGLLDGKEATTHHSSIQGLASRYPKIKMRSDRRIVDNGRIVTVAGVSSGIDGSLHVVARLCGLETAKNTAKYMEYRWEPDPALTAPDAGTKPAAVQAQELWFSGHHREAIQAYKQLVAAQPKDAVAFYRLGSSQMMLGQHQDSQANLAEAVRLGMTDGEVLGLLGYVEVRLAQPQPALEHLDAALKSGFDEWIVHFSRARALATLGRKEEAVACLARSLAGGMGDVNMALLQPDLFSLRSERPFRELFKTYADSRPLRLVLREEPGQPLVVTGVIRGADGQPLAGALLEIYHADNTGVYTKEKAMDEPHARIFGYFRTGADGRFEFRTIRPGHNPALPNVTGEAALIPQHIHINVTAPGHRQRRVQMAFADDPRMTPHWQAWAKKLDFPVVSPVAGADKTLRVECDLTLKAG